jgi:hypothetical protein
VVAAESSGSKTAAAGERSLAFVLGPGRSGTSTMAGALFHSGYHVPNAIKGNETNPVGFFEPRWVVNFHRRLLRSVGLRPLDTDPEAMRRLEGVIGDQEIRDELHDWLARRLEKHGRLVIKDPRMVWFRDLWVDAAERLDVDPRFVIMLRHPSEVSSSRSQFYNSDEVPAVAGWINVALMTEKLTAGSPRALVHYPQLTADWRTELTRLRNDLGLILDPPPEQRPHPVDEFIDPKLRRRKQSWEESSVPVHLQDLGDRTFEALRRLSEEGNSPEIAETLDALRADYARTYSDATALVRPTIRRAREDTTRKVRQQTLAAAARKAAKTTPPPGQASLPRRVVRRIRSSAAGSVNR